MHVSSIARVRMLAGVLIAGLMIASPAAGQPQAAGAQAGERNLTRLMLTWQRDPSSTMTIQWIERAPLLPLQDGQSDALPARSAPDVGPVTVDPAAEPEWVSQALALPYLASPDHARPAPENLSAEARIAWNQRGLLVAVDVVDDLFMENPADDRLWDGDGVELFIAREVGSSMRYQVLFTPGVDPAQPSPRVHLVDQRPGKGKLPKLAIEHAVYPRPGGYRAQFLLPWANLGLDPAEGRRVGFQMIVNDRDEAGQDLGRLTWHPSINTFQSSEWMNALRLAEQAGDPARGRLNTAPATAEGLVHVYAPADLVGQAVTLHATDTPLAAGRFEQHGHVARAVIELPDLPTDHRLGTLHARADGSRLASAALPDQLRTRAPDAAGVRYYPEAQSEAEAQQVTTAVAAVQAWPTMYRHRVELTGLQPDTAYRFNVSGSDRSLAFRTMPATLDRPIRFAVGGDVRHKKHWMVRTNRVAMSHEPDFIVWGGDFAYANADPNQVGLWEQWFEANDETLIDDEGFVTPIVGGVGNHEVQGGYYFNHDGYETTDDWRLRIAPYFYQFFAFPGHPGYNALDFGDYLSLIVLDSDHTTPIAGPQTQWLAQALADRQQVRHVIPVYHVPAFPSHRDYDGAVAGRVREHWLPLFDQSNVRVAFENHDHAYKRTPRIRAGQVDPQGITYIGDGAWGVATRPVHDPSTTWYLEKAESTRHAIIVTLDGSTQRYEVYSEDGELIDQYIDDRE